LGAELPQGKQQGGVVGMLRKPALGLLELAGFRCF
jgi:hypothetical protein